MCGARVTGITLSEEQHSASNARAAEKGLAARCEFRLEDYRDLGERFDRIVSVGMFEHVGVGFYDAFFRKCAELIEDDGIILLHAIGRSEGPNITNPFIAKYIFPGGYIPALSEVLPAVERAGLLVTDIEILRLHYAETLKAWRERFLAHRDDAERIYDPRFLRMWEFYLAASEMAFRTVHHDGVPAAADETPGRGADHARLHRARGTPPAHLRGRRTAAAAARRRITPRLDARGPCRDRSRGPRSPAPRTRSRPCRPFRTPGSR